MSRVTLIATAAFGLESVVARELASLGYTESAATMGKVEFEACLEDIPRTNLWLRTSGRVLVKVGEFPVRSFDELFENTKALPWEDWLPQDAQFPVEGRSAMSVLFSVSDCQAIVKKAVVERMKTRYRQVWFPETGSRYRIEVNILKDIATLTLDTTGAGLHKRGYRRQAGPAPLKETLAAAMLLLSRWDSSRPLIDPFCGSGTIPIEAALIGLGIAPGLRRRFASEGWPIVPETAWQEARMEAEEPLAGSLSPNDISIAGYDLDPAVIEIAKVSATEARVSTHCRFSQRAVRELNSEEQYGLLACNPPYGERMDAPDITYKDLGRAFTRLSTWSFSVLTSFPRFEKAVGLFANRRRKVFNGHIECIFYQFFGPKPKSIRNCQSL